MSDVELACLFLGILFVYKFRYSIIKFVENHLIWETRIQRLKRLEGEERVRRAGRKA